MKIMTSIKDLIPSMNKYNNCTYKYILKLSWNGEVLLNNQTDSSRRKCQPPNANLETWNKRPECY